MYKRQEDTNILSYADALTVSEWAVPAMPWANGAGLIQGSDNNLRPKGNATRAQAAAILHRFCAVSYTHLDVYKRQVFVSL